MGVFDFPLEKLKKYYGEILDRWISRNTGNLL